MDSMASGHSADAVPFLLYSELPLPHATFQLEPWLSESHPSILWELLKLQPDVVVQIRQDAFGGCSENFKGSFEASS